MSKKKRKPRSVCRKPRANLRLLFIVVEIITKLDVVLCFIKKIYDLLKNTFDR
jgi:hypothetical protein